MNFWEEKPDFWGNRIKNNAIYAQQGQELGDYINFVARGLSAKTVLDVGGYKGRMKNYIDKSLIYFNYDIVNGIDITKPWESIGEVRIKYDIIFTSLALITLPPDDLEKVMWEIRGHATKAIILFEEDWHDRVSFEHGSKMSEEYGGKWQYNWMKVLNAKNNNVERLQSNINSHWAIYTKIL